MNTAPFHFHYNKASQAIATLLRAERDKRMNYYRLLKLLYIADRQSVKETGRPIIGGRLVAMKRGPLHSAILDLIQGKAFESPEWSKCFSKDKWRIEMVNDPGNADLSPREIDLLNRVGTEHEAQDEWEVGLFTHSFDEFVAHEPKGDVKVLTIPFADLLAAVGRKDDATAIERDAKAKELFDSVFGA